MPIRARLAVVAALAVALVVIALTTVIFWIVGRELYREVDLSLVRAATRAQLEIKREGAPVERECSYLSSPGCAQVIDREGRRVGAQPDLPAVPGVAREVAAGGHDAAFFNGVLNGFPMRSYVTPLEKGGAVMVSVRADAAERGESRMRAALLLVGGVGIAAAGIIGYLVARTGLRPVTRLTATAERIAATGDPSLRMAVRGRDDEVARLGATFNQMMGTLERSVTAQRRLVADASHELRTPLTSLRANIGLLERDLPPERRERLVGALRGQAAELTGLVNDLIELARGEEPDQDLQEIQLDELVNDCLARARRNWPATDFSGSLAPVTITGLPARLARAVNNLLDNAAKFGDGRVEVTLTPGWELTVRDHGPGIAPDDLPHVFDRFYRSSQARNLPGSGLGLAIVQQVAQLHHATVSAENAPDGGTLIRLTGETSR